MTVERFPVEAGHIMMFARAIGDPNPVYHDEREAVRRGVGGIIAPPTFVKASAQFDPDYPLRPGIGEPWFGSGKTPSGAPHPTAGQSTRLHAEQRFEYHRHPLVGDVLHVRPGQTRRWSKQNRHGRTLQFEETVTEYLTADGQLAVTATQVSVVIPAPASTE